MVSSPHEAMHRIFQEYPELFTGVSQLLGLTLPATSSVTVLRTDLSAEHPIEQLVGTVLRYEHRRRPAVPTRRRCPRGARSRQAQRLGLLPHLPA